jgi:hypothetical protein
VFVDSSPGNDRPSDLPTTRDETYEIDQVRTSVEGQILCFGSAHSLPGLDHADCGAVKELGRTVSYEEGVTVEDLGVLSTSFTEEGSSGGPVFKNQGGYGMVSGEDDPAGEMFYQGLSEVMTRFRLKLPPVT